MAIENDKTIVGFIPVIENGDIKKIYDHSVVKFNEIILGLLHQLNMFKGTLTDYPELGCRDALVKIPFSSETYSTAHELEENFSRFRTDSLRIDILREGGDNSTAHLHIEVSDVPNLKLVADIEERNQGVRIVNPSIIDT